MNRKEFFKHPCTVKEIFGNKKEIIRFSSEKNLNEQIKGLRQYQGGEIIFPILPEEFRDKFLFQQGEITDMQRDDIEYLKHGTLIKIPRYKSKKKAEEEQKHMWELRKETYEKAKHKSYAGILWWGLGREKIPHIIRLVESAEAQKIITRHLTSKDMIDKVKINLYEPQPQAKIQGGEYLVDIYSREHDFWYPTFNIRRIPIINNEHQYSIVTEFNSDHNCGKSSSRKTVFKDRKTGKMEGVEHCAHVLAAYYLIAHHNANQHNWIPMDNLVFPLLTGSMLDLYKKARTQVMVWETHVNEEGLTESRHRPLKEGELEKILHDEVFERSYMNTLYGSRKDPWINFKWH